MTIANKKSLSIKKPFIPKTLIKWLTKVFDNSQLDELPSNFEKIKPQVLALALLNVKVLRSNEKIKMDCWSSAVDVSMQFLKKIDDVRLVVTGQEFDDIWSMFEFEFRYGVWGGDNWRPNIMYNGSLLLRNHHRVIGLDDHPTCEIEIPNSKLRDALNSMRELTRNNESENDANYGFSMVHHSSEGFVWTRNVPEKLSDSGQTIIFIPKVWIDIAIENSISPLNNEGIQKACESSRSGHAVLRVFANRFYVHSTHRADDNLDLMLEEYSNWLGESPDEEDVLKLTELNHNTEVQFAKRSQEHIENDNIQIVFKDLSPILSALVKNSIFNECSGNLNNQLSNLFPIFSSDYKSPVTYYAPKPKYMDYAHSVDGKLVVFEFSVGIGKSPNGLKKFIMNKITNLFDKIDLKTSAMKIHIGRNSNSGYFYIDENLIFPFDDKNKGLSDSFKEMSKELKENVKEAIGDQEVITLDMAEIEQDVMDNSSYYINILVPVDTDPQPSLWDSKSLTMSEYINGTFTMSIPTYGFCCGYCEGDHDTGNNMTLIPSENDD